MQNPAEDESQEMKMEDIMDEDFDEAMANVLQMEIHERQQVSCF